MRIFASLIQAIRAGRSRAADYRPTPRPHSLPYTPIQGIRRMDDPVECPRCRAAMTFRELCRHQRECAAWPR